MRCAETSRSSACTASTQRDGSQRVAALALAVDHAGVEASEPSRCGRRCYSPASDGWSNDPQ